MHLTLEQLPCLVEMDYVVPCFLDDVDHPWLQRLIERAQAARGLRAADVDEHMMATLPIQAPASKHRLAAYMLTRSFAYRTDASLDPGEVRDRLFTAAAASAAPRADVVASVAARCGVTGDALLAAMLADLPSERIVEAIAEDFTPASLAARANVFLAGAFVSRATTLRIEVVGASRNFVRVAKARGLLCAITGSADGGAATLELSGPMSLFKHTRLYGRALAALLPTLAWCDRWILEAVCVLAHRPARFRLSTGAPIAPSPQPARFDSKVEERFAADFAVRAPGFDLVREPRPIVAGDALLFPDFAMTMPDGETFFVEIVGFWTPRYLEQKLARLRLARIDNLVLCVDEALGCAEGVMIESARVVSFKRRVDVERVLHACGWALPATARHEPRRRRRRTRPPRHLND